MLSLQEREALLMLKIHGKADTMELARNVSPFQGYQQNYRTHVLCTVKLLQRMEGRGLLVRQQIKRCPVVWQIST